MLKLKSLSFLAFLSAFVAQTASAAAPKGPQLIGEYRDWVAYYADDSQGRVCYIASTPKRDEGKYTKRGDIYVVVTHRPAEQSFDVVNFVGIAVFMNISNVFVKGRYGNMFQRQHRTPVIKVRV